MRHDRDGGKRTNWLLIKHRDDYAKEGEANDILDEDKSVASGRTMDADRRRQGQGAKAVHAGQGQDARAPTRSGIRTAAMTSDARAGRNAACEPRRDRTRAAKGRRRCRISSRRSSAPPSSGRRAANGWCHEIKFDGYRVQLRVEDGEAALKTRKGLDWTDKFGAIAKAAQRAARRADRRRDRRARPQRRAGFFQRCRPRSPTARPII